MDLIDQDQDATAHLLEVEPVALFGCTMTELKYLSIISIGSWLLLFFVMTLPFGQLLWIFLSIPLAFFFGAITTWRLSRSIKRLKVGKPHHFYIHILQRDILSKFGLSPWSSHVGRYRLGRTIHSGTSSCP